MNAHATRLALRSHARKRRLWRRSRLRALVRYTWAEFLARLLVSRREHPYGHQQTPAHPRMAHPWRTHLDAELRGARRLRISYRGSILHRQPDGYGADCYGHHDDSQRDRDHCGAGPDGDASALAVALPTNRLCRLEQ